MIMPGKGIEVEIFRNHPRFWELREEDISDICHFEGSMTEKSLSFETDFYSFTLRNDNVI
jgi:hypothetical protein